MSNITVKKNFQELVSLLEKNKDMKVKDLLPSILEIVTSKKKAETVRRDEKGRVTEIFCWYHKEWEPAEWYGKKSSSASGFNTMCKIGVNQWTKQQSEAKKSRDNILDDIQKGILDPSKINDKLAVIEDYRKRIVARK